MTNPTAIWTVSHTLIFQYPKKIIHHHLITSSEDTLDHHLSFLATLSLNHSYSLFLSHRDYVQVAMGITHFILTWLHNFVVKLLYSFSYTCENIQFFFWHFMWTFSYRSDYGKLLWNILAMYWHLMLSKPWLDKRKRLLMTFLIGTICEHFDIAPLIMTSILSGL